MKKEKYDPFDEYESAGAKEFADLLKNKTEISDDGGRTWKKAESFEDLLNIDDWQPLDVCSYGELSNGQVKNCDRPRQPGSEYCVWHSDPANNRLIGL